VIISSKADWNRLNYWNKIMHLSALVTCVCTIDKVRRVSNGCRGVTRITSRSAGWTIVDSRSSHL
jgi:hypothetical protein